MLESPFRLAMSSLHQPFWATIILYFLCSQLGGCTSVANYVLLKNKYIELFNKWGKMTTPLPSFPISRSLWNHKQIIGNGHLFPPAPMTNETDITGP